MSAPRGAKRARASAAIATAALVVLAIGGACGKAPDTACTPGESVFCKCPGGADGSKVCRADGQGFDACVGDSGTCELPATTTGAGGSGGAPATSSTSSAGSTTSSVASSSSSGSGGAGGGPPTFMVVRIGDGTVALSSAAHPVFVEERALDGSLVPSAQNPIPLPTASDAFGGALTLSGTSSSEGGLTRSGDGHSVELAGYDAAPGTAAVSSSTSATVNRVIGSIDAFAFVDTSTRLNAAFSGQSVRSAASQDGLGFWAAGSGSGSNGGVHYAAIGMTGSTNVLTTPSATRVVSVFGGQLYADSATSGFATVFSVGVGLPKITAAGTTPLPGLPTTGGSPYGYALLDRDPMVAGVDTLYLSDDRTPAAGGGVSKWTFDGLTWTESAAFKPSLGAGVRGLAALDTPPMVTVVVSTAETSANRLVTIVDDGSATPVVTVVATAPTNQIFRGVAPSPF